MRAATAQEKRDRALLIMAVKSHLMATHWMPGMPGSDFETRDEFHRLLEKMQRVEADEAMYESLVADLVADGLEPVWAMGVAGEWMTVRAEFISAPDPIVRSVVLSRLLAFVDDEWAHHMVETLFARLAQNAAPDQTV